LDDIVKLATAAMGFLTAVAVVVQIVLARRIAQEQKTAAQQVAVKAEQAKVAVEEVASRAEEAKVTLASNTSRADAKLDDIARTGEKTHTLVNSNMAVQLKLNAAVTRRLADLTKDPIDEEAANLAEKLSHEHETKQTVVDKQVVVDLGS
jgi:hypothetical protein